MNLAKAILVGGKHCSVCHALHPKIKELINTKFPKMDYIFSILEEEQNPEIRNIKVSAIPTLIIFFENKEFFRFERSFSLLTVEEMMERPYQLLFGHN